MSDPAPNFNCLLVDDEVLAQDLLAMHLARMPQLRVVGRCQTAVEAMVELRSRHVDLLFLDIRMPGITGLEFLRSLSRPPLTILTTAYAEHAIDGFELDVVDYLLKPVTFERFLKAANKALRLLDDAAEIATTPEDARGRSMLVKVDQKEVKVELDRILFVEAMEKYVKIHLPEGRHVTLLSLARMEEILPPSRFLRVHKSYLINVEKVEAIAGNEAIVGGKAVPIARHAKEVLRRMMNSAASG